MQPGLQGRKAIEEGPQGSLVLGIAPPLTSEREEGGCLKGFRKGADPEIPGESTCHSSSRPSSETRVRLCVDMVP